jgi:hypothetical protein
VLLLETPDHGRLDGGGGRLDELPHVLEGSKDVLAGHSELFGEFMDSGFSHVSPSWVVRPKKGADRQFSGVLIGEFSSRGHELLLRPVVVVVCWYVDCASIQA